LNAKSLRTFFKMIFVAYPDFHIAVEDRVLDGWRAVTIERVTGHWRGPYYEPGDGQNDATQRSSLRSSRRHVHHLRARPHDQELSSFWDTLVVDKQLGVTP
jgi:hypothetical protein